MGHKYHPIKNILDRLGPGLITGASDDDPSGIGTYSQAGAALGYTTLWTAIVTLPLMVVVQHICAKIGMCSGRGLAGVLHRYYSKKLLYPVVIGLVIANTINAGADIAAIAAAINMFIPIPISAMVIPIAVAIVVLQVWGSYRLILKIFKWLTLSLFAYVIAAFFSEAGLVCRCKSHIHSTDLIYQRIHHDCSRNTGHDNLAVSLFLGGGRRGRGRKERGPDEIVRAKRCDRRRDQEREDRHDRRDAFL